MPRKNISIYRLSPQYLRGSSEKPKKEKLVEVEVGLYSIGSFIIVVVITIITKIKI